MKLDLTPPKGWNILPLSRIITGLRGGVSVNGTDLPARNGEPGVLKLSAISYGQFAPEQNKAVIENERSRLGPSVRSNTILISRSNTTELVGACVYVPEDFPHLYLPDLIWEIEVDPSNGNSAKWLSYMLSSGAVRASLVARATGTSGSMKKLSMAALRVMQIWQPPFPEQERIAEIITTWDRAMAQAEKLIEAKRKLKTGLMQQLLTGKRRFKEFVKSEETRRTKYGELPVDWDLVCIRDIADVNKRSLPNSTAPDYEFFYVL
jgi:type I restriction enzyme S subunit